MVDISPAEDWRHGGFGVYVHWPFCAAKCPYCDFNSHVPRGAINHRRWAKALIRELTASRALTGSRGVDTIFFGGGTPSLMDASTVTDVLDAIDRLWGIKDGAEITLEANPTSVEASRFAAYAAAGVNRISMGIQALDDASLRALGRLHTASEAREAFDIARARFARVSFDLIYARMGQSLGQWEAELTAALSMAVDHLSLYQLTIEPGTRFADLATRGRLTVPDDDIAAEMFDRTQTVCDSRGFHSYEVSNHARPGAESRHNLIYWRYGDYVGAGPGAHGRLTVGGSREATVTQTDPKIWLDRVETEGHAMTREPLDLDQQSTEYLLMAMRLTEGVELARFAALSGHQLDCSTLDELTELKLIRQTATHLSTTMQGRLVLNAVLRRLLETRGRPVQNSATRG